MPNWHKYATNTGALKRKRFSVSVFQGLPYMCAWVGKIEFRVWLPIFCNRWPLILHDAHSENSLHPIFIFMWRRLNVELTMLVCFPFYFSVLLGNLCRSTKNPFGHVTWNQKGFRLYKFPNKDRQRTSVRATGVDSDMLIVGIVLPSGTMCAAH
jgi:hypothetical protein